MKAAMRSRAAGGNVTSGSDCATPKKMRGNAASSSSAENAAWVRSELWYGTLGVPGETTSAPLTLSAAAPNPSRGEAALTFTLPSSGPVDLRLFDVSGREVVTLTSGPHAAGLHTVRWDGREARGEMAPAGVYFARLATASGGVSRRLLRLP